MFLRSLRRISSMASSDVATLVNDYIRNHKVVVFSKSYCPFCMYVLPFFLLLIKTERNIRI